MKPNPRHEKIKPDFDRYRHHHLPVKTELGHLPMLASRHRKGGFIVYQWRR